MDFTHLHVHSEYSLLDGACRIKPLVKAAKERGMTSLAITDHGVMYGVVEFYKQAKKEGIHPIIGCEVYVAPGRMEEKNVTQREYAHLVLLCENQEGYKNLTKLSSLGFTKGFYYKPRVDVQALRDHHEGLIALSACLSGDVPRLILEGRFDDAQALALTYQEIFGVGNYYLELQDHGIPEQRLVNEGIMRIARATGIPLVATNDVHYISADDVLAQEVLMCISTGKTLADEQRMQSSSDQGFLKTPEEMAALFPYAPEAISNTCEIARRCQVEFELGKYHLPVFPVPQGHEASEYLRTLCEKGIKERYGEPLTQEVRERLDYELNMIIKMGYVDYFLIVWDFIRYAKEHEIMVGPGRGSGAGSIVAYSLGITGVDPLQYGLIFERFLNPERITMPDIDIDFCYERRQEVIDYVVSLYGEDRVSQIITFGTMAARGAIRDVARVLSIPYQDADKIAKAIPFALDMTLDRALEISSELRTLVEENEQAAQLFRIARSLEGMPRHASTHAAGVVIAAKPLTDYVPVQTNDDVITTQFPMGTVEELGLLKMDFLGLRTLTVIRSCLDMLKANRGIDMEPEDIPMDDPDTYIMLGEGDTDGVFQLESDGMRRVLTELKPSVFEDIIAVISLYRPGPMDSIPRYIDGKKHADHVHYEHPILEKALSVTYGCMVYQEQVMQIVRDMAGYSMARSDLVRRAMSKKDRNVMEKERSIFIHGLVDENGDVEVPGAVRSGVPEEVAAEVFGQMESFAQYAFNKSHAASYAVVALQTAWLKRHYPVEFMAACMNSILGNSEKIAAFIQFCRKHGIAVLPPDVNHSGSRFTVDGDNIRFGLVGVRNVGSNAVKSLIRSRQERPFSDFYEFCERADTDYINKRAVESLIKAGALDSLQAKRSQMLTLYEPLLDAAINSRKRNVQGQVSLFGMEEAMADSAFDVRPPLPDIPESSPRLLLEMEKEMTGVYISGHPLDEYREQLENMPLNTLLLASMGEEENAVDKYDGQTAVMAGILQEKRTKTTRTDKLMCFIQLEDLYGVVEGLVFPRVYDRYRDMLEKDALLVVSGKLSLREEETPKLLVDRVEPLIHKKNQRMLCLRVQDMEQAVALLPLLQRYKGDVPVAMRVLADGSAIRAQCSVMLGEALVAELSDMLGKENVVVR